MSETKIVLIEAKRLEVQEGDTIVLSHPGLLTEDATEKLREQIRENFLERLGINITVMVFEEGLRVDSVLVQGAGDE